MEEPTLPAARPPRIAWVGRAHPQRGPGHTTSFPPRISICTQHPLPSLSSEDPQGRRGDAARGLAPHPSQVRGTNRRRWAQPTGTCGKRGTRGEPGSEAKERPGAGAAISPCTQNPLRLREPPPPPPSYTHPTWLASQQTAHSLAQAGGSFQPCRHWGPLMSFLILKPPEGARATREPNAL